MALYKYSNQKLSPIKGTEFELERDLQRLLEDNLEPLFGLQFIATEFSFNNLRLDSVAYDAENNCFVIIEYKRDKASSVVDQGYAYLSLVLNNQAEFVLEYNKKTGSSQDKQDFDWGATRIMFVASRFTPHQLEAINFRDLPFELWEVQPYEGDLLRIEQKIATKQVISIKSITKRPSVSSNEQDTIEREIKTFTVEDAFPSSKADVRSLYDELDEQIRGLDDAIVANPRKPYVSYRVSSDWRNFIYVIPYKHGVRVDMSRTELKDINDPEHRVKYDEISFKYKNQHICQLHINSSDDIEYAMSIIRQVYKRHIQEYGK
jgi:predicted transport protein